ncbi:MAG: hypothetical protein AAF908_05335, partial [Pseudomonadota bacterium]
AALIEAIDRSAPDLVLRVGDTKPGGAICSDERLAEQLDFMARRSVPVIFTPGDNDWTDCHGQAAGGFDPRERLAHIRATYFADPQTTLGKPIPITSQADQGFPENTRLTREGITVIAAHLVGSNNGFEPGDPAAAAEFAARDRANIAWLRAGFAEATQAESAGIILALHADLFKHDWNTFGQGKWLGHSGFRRFGRVLIEEAKTFGRPILLVHGDGHRFGLSRPWPREVPNLLALEVFGARHMHAVEILADPAERSVFAIRPFWHPDGF